MTEEVILENTIVTVANHEPGSMRERALQVDRRLREIYTNAQRDFIEMGYLLCEAEDSALWAHLENENGESYSSFDNWISTALPYGRTSAFSAKNAVRTLGSVPREQLKAIPRVNLERLMKLPDDKREKMIEAATVMTENEFATRIHLLLPPTAKEKKMQLRFNLDRAGFKAVTRALAKATEALAEKDTKATKEAQLIEVCESFLAITTKVGRPKKKMA